MNPALTHIHDTLHHIKSQIEKDIIGQSELIDKMLITFFAGGHALIEWVPGLGKTKAVRTFARVIGLDTGRISFTPDLLPSDLTGNEIYRPGKWTFEVRKWPIFTHILLADEINRTPPKVQSALLEAMEEKKVTIGDETFPLPSPFVVFATQNPLEHEGTYPLPEAQLDRFLMCIILDYPNTEDEKRIFVQETSKKDIETATDTKEDTSIDPEKENKKTAAWLSSVSVSITEGDILEMIDYIARSVRVDEKIYEYVSDLISATRKLTLSLNQLTTQPANQPILSYGASTRAGLALIRASKVRAVIERRDYVLPEDIKSLAHAIIDHRIWLSYESASDGVTAYAVIEDILDSVRIP